MYTIHIDKVEAEAILCALGSTAWANRNKSAFATYDNAYKNIRKQIKGL